MPRDPVIDALLREREGYERSNKPDRASQVAAQLAARGYKRTQPETASAPVTPPKAEPETASIEAPETATIPRGRPRRSEP